jgi:hypothetical protein
MSGSGSRKAYLARIISGTRRQGKSLEQNYAEDYFVGPRFLVGPNNTEYSSMKTRFVRAASVTL